MREKNQLIPSFIKDSHPELYRIYTIKHSRSIAATIDNPACVLRVIILDLSEPSEGSLYIN